MRIVIIGGTGHVGTYLVPRLARLGHEVISVSRELRQPYHSDSTWTAVRKVSVDREAEEQAGSFGARILSLEPDAVIDMICFRLESARQLVDALRGRVQHFLHCGTIWVYGHSVEVPATEEQPRRPFGEYGCRKAEIEAYLLDEARRRAFPATCLHPGHIVGPGWEPVNPAGHRDPQVFADLAAGREVTLPNLGMETLHHVHADDVAQAFQKAIGNRSVSVGESFHVVSPAAVTLRGYAEAAAGWFGREANLRFLPWEEWRSTVPESNASTTWDHIAHSPNASIAKAARLLGYQPRYSSLEAVRQSVEWLIAAGRLVV